MPNHTTQQRLAAVLAADVVGYTRLMEKDTDGTVAAWQAVRDGVIKPAVADRSGRIVKLTGDGFLAEFPTVHEAVNCGIAMQEGFARSSLEFRIGINLGDIVDDGEDIHGEGVNVAARIEALAEPGGICISGGVYDQIRHRVDAAYEDLGEKQVKNVSEPVRVYKITTANSEPDAPAVDVSAPVAGFTGRPAIAVMPFDNMSGDPDQEFFADGLTEDLITRLSYWRWFPVIARNSTFAFKGQSPDIKEVGEKLGARYVVEGSVRKAGNRIRVSAQLIDATNGHHVWAERYDRDLEDIFAVQDEITDHIVGALEPAIGMAEQQRARVGRPENMDAWEACQRGFWHYYRAAKDELELAVSWFKKSVELDPEFAMSWGGLAQTYFTEIMAGYAQDMAQTRVDMRIAAQRALAISDQSARGHLFIGWAEIFDGNNDAAVGEMRRAVDHNPSSATAHFYLGLARMLAGHPEEALDDIDRATRLSPRDPLRGRFEAVIGLAHTIAGNNEAAVESAKKSALIAPDHPMVQRDLAIALACAGRMDEAKAALDAFLRLSPNYSIKRLRDTMRFKNPADFEPAIELLRELGLPEG